MIEGVGELCIVQRQLDAGVDQHHFSRTAASIEDNGTFASC